MTQRMNLILTDDLYQKVTEKAKEQFRSRQSLLRQLIADLK